MITWGQLAKSQTDPEKIEEAIARMIAEHDANPESHLGEGGSLKSHKMAEIIDHLVQSIVADKFSGKQMMFRSSFESLDGWRITSGSVSLSWPGIVLITGSTAGSEASIIATSAGVPDFFNNSKNLLFQVNLRVDNASNVEWWADWGVYSDDMPGESAFGFRFVGGKLQAFLHDGTNLFTVDISGFTITDPHIYRAEINSTEKKIYYYIDGILVATISYTTWTYAQNRSASFQIKTLTSQLRRMYLHDLLMARDL
jgi:hypothetical protein